MALRNGMTLVQPTCMAWADGDDGRFAKRPQQPEEFLQRGELCTSTVHTCLMPHASFHRRTKQMPAQPPMCDRFAAPISFAPCFFFLSLLALLTPGLVSPGLSSGLMWSCLVLSLSCLAFVFCLALPCFALPCLPLSCLVVFLSHSVTRYNINSINEDWVWYQSGDYMEGNAGEEIRGSGIQSTRPPCIFCGRVGRGNCWMDSATTTTTIRSRQAREVDICRGSRRRGTFHSGSARLSPTLCTM
jgi:hypothetical protein